MNLEGVQVSSEEFIDYTLDNTFSLCWKMTGLPKDKFPDQETTKLIHLNTLKHFGEFSFEDILLAFELCVNGKYEKDIEHYHTVSSAYVSKVLRGYQEYKRSKINALNKKLDYYSTDLLAEYEEEVRLNDESIKNMIVGAYEHCLSGGSRKTFKVHTVCAEVMKAYGLYDIKRVVWEDLLKKAKEEFITKQESLKTGVKVAETTDHTASAKIMYLWCQLEAWKEDGMFEVEMLREKLDKDKILPSDYKEKVKQFEQHRKNMVV